MHSNAVFYSWLIHPPLFLLTQSCMCVKCAFASMNWPLHRWIIEFLSVSPQPIFFWSSLWIDIYRAPTFCLHQIEVNQCTVWYLSTRVTLKNTPQIQRGEHNMGHMNLSAEVEFETGLHLSLGCSHRLISLVFQSFHFYFLFSFVFYFFIII